MTGASDMSSPCPLYFVEWVKSTMRQAFELTNYESQKAANRQKKYNDRGLNPREFKVGILCGEAIT